MRGFEPPSLATYASEAYAYTNSATCPEYCRDAENRTRTTNTPCLRTATILHPACGPTGDRTPTPALPWPPNTIFLLSPHK